MIAETKYDIGDTFWAIDNWGKVYSGIVNSIEISCRKDGRMVVVYSWEASSSMQIVKELEMFSSKNEAGIELLKRNGFDIELVEL